MCVYICTYVIYIYIYIVIYIVIYIYNYISYTKKICTIPTIPKDPIEDHESCTARKCGKRKKHTFIPKFSPVTTKDPTFTFCHGRLTQFSF